MAGVVRAGASPVGPVVRPPGPSGMVILYLYGDHYLSGPPESGARPGEMLRPANGGHRRLFPLPARVPGRTRALLDLTLQAPSLLLNAAADPMLDSGELLR